MRSEMKQRSSFRLAALCAMAMFACPAVSQPAIDRSDGTLPTIHVKLMRQVLQRHAQNTAAWEACGLVVSEVRRMKEKAISLAHLLDIMREADARDYFSDQLGLARLSYRSKSCQETDLKRVSKIAIETHDRFYQAFAVPKIKENEQQIKELQRKIDKENAALNMKPRP